MKTKPPWGLSRELLREWYLDRMGFVPSGYRKRPDIKRFVQVDPYPYNPRHLPAPISLSFISPLDPKAWGKHEQT